MLSGFVQGGITTFSTSALKSAAGPSRTAHLALTSGPAGCGALHSAGWNFGPTASESCTGPTPEMQILLKAGQTPVLWRPEHAPKTWSKEQKEKEGCRALTSVSQNCGDLSVVSRSKDHLIAVTKRLPAEHHHSSQTSLILPGKATMLT